MKLYVTNRFCTLASVDRSLYRKIDRRTAYRVAGYIFNPRYRTGGWDGREHLCCPTKKGIRFPVGLLADVLQVLDNLGTEVEVVDQRRPVSGKRLGLVWAWEHGLREYKQEAVQLVQQSDTPISEIDRNLRIKQTFSGQGSDRDEELARFKRELLQ